MKMAEVEIGSVYLVKVSGRLQPVKVCQSHKGYKDKVYWTGYNLNTNRHIHIRSAAKLRKKVGA